MLYGKGKYSATLLHKKASGVVDGTGFFIIATGLLKLAKRTSVNFAGSNESVKINTLL